MKTINKTEVSISIPCYNEEKNVNVTIPSIFKKFSENSIQLQIIAVNNGSKDNTLKNLKLLKRIYPNLEIVDFKKNQGFGGGIIAGMEKGTSEIIGFTCADDQIKAEDVFKTYEFLKKNNLDVVKTKRLKRYDGISRFIVSKIFNILSRVLFGIKTSDINGYPVMIKKNLFDKMKLNKKNWMINIEILVKSKILKSNVGEIQTIFYKRLYGKSSVKTKTLFDFFIQIFEFWPEFLFGSEYRKLRKMRG